MTSLLTIPQARIPLGWAMVQGQRVPVEVDMEWMRYFSTLTDRSGGVTGITSFSEYVNQFYDAQPSDPALHEAVSAIAELWNEFAQGKDPQIHDLLIAIDDLRTELASIASKEQSLRGQIDDLTSSMEGITRAEQLRARVDDIEHQMEAGRPAPLMPTAEEFIAPTLINGWANYGAPFNNAGYYKDPFGIVHLRGMVKSGAILSAIFTLPAGYRPANTELVSTISNDAFARLNIGSTGDVLPVIGNNAYFSLDNISFRAA